MNRNPSYKVKNNISEFKMEQPEKSNISILCVDIVQSTKEISHMDVEEARDWVEPAINLMIHAVNTYNGIVYEFTGDGIVAVFNIKDHEMRSCLAALLLQSLMKSIEFTHHSRISIYSTYIKTVKNDELWHEAKQLGIAQKLQDFAPIDQIIVSESLQQKINSLLLLGKAEQVTLADKSFVVYPLINLSSAGQQYLQKIPELSIVKDKSDKTTSQKLEAERKYITSLFVRFNSKKPEDLQKAIEICSALTTKFEGLTLKRSGGVLYLIFGAPVSLEDHPLRACITAYTLLEKIQDNNLEVEIQVGINSGEVLMDAIGTAEFQQYDAIGLSVNLAARMMQTAQKNQIQITKSTLNAIKPYITYMELGNKTLKGFVDEVAAFSLTGLKIEAIRSHREMNLYERTPFFGRHNEKKIFKKNLENLSHHRGNILGVCAMAGLGKSHLAYELSKIAKEDNVEVFAVTQSSYDTQITFSSLKLLLESLFNINNNDDDTTIIATLEAELEGFHFTEKFHLESLLTILGVDVKTPGWAGSSPVIQKKILYTTLNEYLEEKSNAHPLMLIMDDLQWCDEETLQFLASLVTLIHEHSLMLILNFRTDFDFKHWFQNNGTLLNLEPLDKDSCEELTKALLPGLKNIEEARKKIVELSEGNPFMIQEYTDMLIDNKEIIQNQDGTYSVSSKINLKDMPLSVRGIFTSRIDHLSKEEKRVLLQASVLGKTFSLSFLSYLNDIKDLDLKKILNTLHEKSFIYESSLIPEPEYIFAHSSICDVAYDTILKKDKQLYHKALVEHIESDKSQELKKYYYTLAHHCKAGAIWDKAIHYYNLIIPSEPTITFTADQFLIMPLKSKECFEHLTLKEKEEIFTHHGRTQLMYVYGLLMKGDMENMMAVIETVKEEALQFNNKLIEAMAEVWFIMFSSMVGACSPVLPLCERVASLKNELKEIIPPKDFEIVALDMDLAPLHLAWPLGDYTLFDKSFEIYEKSSVPMTALSHYLGSAPITIAFLHHAFCYLFRADINSMRKRIPRIIKTLKNDLAVSETSIGLNACIGLYKYSIGNFKKAEKIFENVLTMSEELNFGSLIIMFQPYMISSLIYNGHREEAKAPLEILLSMLREMHFSAIPTITLQAADIAITLKDWEKAWEAINNIQPIVETDNEKPAIAHCYRLRAQLLDLTDPQHTHDEEILHLLTEAKKITEEVGCYRENPFIELALAEFYKNRDQMEKYHHHYEKALSYFKEYKMVGWYKYYKKRHEK